MPQTEEERQDQKNKLLALRAKLSRDIGEIPEVVDPARKEACRLDFKLFCETYFAQVFSLAWASFHLDCIAKFQRVILHGGQYGLALPRSSGKSKLCDAAAVWATFYGHRRYVVLVGASEGKAQERINAYKDSLLNNPLLLADFPEACFPVQKLERSTNRTKSQTCLGEFTQIVWKDASVQLPTIPGSPASGAIVQTAGITGAIRGSNAQVNGEALRPDLVFVDDPQTRASAKSKSQVDTRIKILHGDILKLGRPGEKLACFCPCTVVENDDLADQILDRGKHPIWQGKRVKLLRSMPTNTKLWEQYDEIRNNCLRYEDGNIAKATAFYAANREAMDAGADPSWPARYENDEISAVQFGMNQFLSEPITFAAEYQNEPLKAELGDVVDLTRENIVAKITKSVALKRGVLPVGTTMVTAFVDVQQKLLFYAVVATVCDSAKQIKSIHLVKYGTYPDQKSNSFTARNAKRTLQEKYPGWGEESQIMAGLEALTTSLCERQWPREDNGTIKISQLFVDSGMWTTTVKQACRNSKYSALIQPTKGVSFTADKKPLNDYRDVEDEEKGWCWRLYNKDGRLDIDTNSWKTFMAQRILTPAGGEGCFTIHNGSEASHKLIIDHLTSEFAIPTMGNGSWGQQVVNVWRLKPNRENHLLDCVVGALVAASKRGALGVGHAATQKVLRKRRKFTAKF